MDKLSPGFPDFPEFAAGQVWLVGAGPGDPRLLTLMALHALRSADTIVHDALVDPGVLALAADAAGFYPVGKRGGEVSTPQNEINRRLVELARAGNKVLRLKGGDPFVFGRGGEEARVLAEAGVPFRVVPGLTAGLSAAAMAGIPATTRETNHAIVLATGYRAPDGAADDWEAIARTGQPVILYMALSRIGEISAAFLRSGAQPDLPVTVISRATLPGERLLETTLGSVETDVRTAALAPPAIVIIGTIAALRDELLPTLLMGR